MKMERYMKNKKILVLLLLIVVSFIMLFAVALKVSNVSSDLTRIEKHIDYKK